MQSFPRPGRRVRNAHRELSVAANGTAEQKQSLGPIADLPRPWDPATCAEPDLRRELWEWLEAVVGWLNHEHTWDLTGLVPACWPLHPHLVREIALLADQRRRAAEAMSSDPLEDWHRYCLPSFIDRMSARLRSHCEEGHQPWPARSRHARSDSDGPRHSRTAAYTADIELLREAARDRATSRDRVREQETPGGQRLGLVDLDTGELHDD